MRRFLLALMLLPLVRSEGQYFDRLTQGQRYYTQLHRSSSPKTRNGAGGSSYGAPQTYSAASKPSYSGGHNKGISFKTFSIPIPDLNLPSPVEFKSGVLRSKGRIASGLLHAKAGILRAGAHILAQKAAVLDRVANTIPSVKAHLIKQLKQQQQNSGYGNQVGYGAPRPTYGGNSANNINYGAQSNNINYGAQSNNNVYNAQSAYNGGISPGLSAPDSYGSPLGNPIGSNFNNNINNNNNNNYQAGGNSIPLSSSINVGADSYGSPLGSPLGSVSSVTTSNIPAPIAVNSNPPQSNNVFLSNVSPGSNTFLLSDASQGTGVDPGLVDSFVLQESRNPSVQDNSLLQGKEALRSGNLETCRSQSSLSSLLTDIFLGHEIIPDILDEPPVYPLDLSYKTIRTFPGMHVTADMTRFKPVLHWPYEPEALYTLVLSNLDINSRRNRTLSEFWHWFVANIPGDSVDNGEVIFELLFPLVLPEGDGDHRFGVFVFKQPGRMDYSSEGGKADSCSPTMSNGRGPFKSTKSFQIKYDLELTASTFFILDYNKASMEIACDWQKCIGDTINLVSPLQCGNNF